MKFKVTGMTCAACSARVERAVSSLADVSECEVNLLLGTMSVTADTEPQTIIDAVIKAGYSASSDTDGETLLSGGKSDSDKGGEDGEKKSIFRSLLASSILLIILMYISMGHVMWGMPIFEYLETNPTAIAITEAILSAAIIIINKRFFINGYKGIIRLSPNMDTLVALGSGVSFIYSIVML